MRIPGGASTVTIAEDGARRIMPGRQPCRGTGCFASFEDSPALNDEVRHCNRGGVEGGHPHRWDLTSWQLVADTMEHDRS